MGELPYIVDEEGLELFPLGLDKGESVGQAHCPLVEVLRVRVERFNILVQKSSNDDRWAHMGTHDA